MALVLTDNANYAAIAEAIRLKKDESTVYKPREMAAAIRSITVYEGRCPRAEPQTVYVNAAGALSWDSTADISLPS